MATLLGDEAMDSLLLKFGVTELKYEQKKILNCLIDGKDCMAVLPTGYGKSLPYQLFVPMKREIHKGFNQKMIVCSPLISLMQDQVEKLTAIGGVTAAYKGQSADSDQLILDGKVDVIYASPETLVGDKDWRSALQNFEVSTIVVDEFHTVATWGENEDDPHGKAFRKWFSNIGELRSLFPDASILALSATCTQKIRKRVKKLLELKSDLVEISRSPNKDNIKFVIAKINTSVEIAMCWIVDGLNSKRKDFPRTAVYCRTIKDAALLYDYLSTELPDCAKFIDMYHSLTPSTQKQAIMEGLKDASSDLRIVIATSALGMGIDIVEFNSVVVFGIPDSLVDLIQEIGRVGRNGKPSISLLLFHSYHQRGAKKEIKEVFRCTGCRRVAIMSPFLKKEELETLKKSTGVHTCCDFCASSCQCGKCSTLSLEDMFNADDVSDLELEEYDSEATIDYEYEASDNDEIMDL